MQNRTADVSDAILLREASLLPLEQAPRLRVLWMERVSLAAGWRMGETCDSFWRLYWNSGEGMDLRTGQTAQRVPARSAVLIPSGVRFEERARAALEHTFIHFAVSGGGLPSGSADRAEPLVLDSDAALSDRMRIVHGLMDASAHDGSLASRVYAVLYDAIADWWDARRAGCSADPHQAALAPILPALQRIEEIPQTPASNMDLARLCHMSRSHFVRTFRRLTGQSPQQYALAYRLSLSARELVQGDFSIEWIAERCGFGSRYYFSRVFAEHLGMPPAAFRRQGKTPKKTSDSMRRST